MYLKNFKIEKNKIKMIVFIMKKINQKIRMKGIQNPQTFLKMNKLHKAQAPTSTNKPFKTLSLRNNSICHTILTL